MGLIFSKLVHKLVRQGLSCSTSRDSHCSMVAGVIVVVFDTLQFSYNQAYCSLDLSGFSEISQIFFNVFPHAMKHVI